MGIWLRKHGYDGHRLAEGSCSRDYGDEFQCQFSVEGPTQIDYYALGID